MENTCVDSPDGYSLPPVVEWLSFIVDQLKATVNVFSAQVQVVLTEYVHKNLTDLLREDYRSAQISRRVVHELQENVNKVIHNLLDQSQQVEEELSARFSRIQLGNQKRRKHGSVSTDQEIKRSKYSEVFEVEETSNVAGSSGVATRKTTLNRSDRSNISDDSTDITELNSTNQTWVQNHDSDVEIVTISEKGLKDKSSKTNMKRRSARAELYTESADSLDLIFNAESVSDSESVSYAEPVTDGDVEFVKAEEEPSKENFNNCKSDEAQGSTDNDLPINYEDPYINVRSPVSPAETVFFEAESEDNDNIEDKNNALVASLLRPPSPDETVFLGTPYKNASPFNLSCKRLTRSQMCLAFPPSPPETVFFEKSNIQDKKNNCDLEMLAKKSVLYCDSDDDDDSMEGPSSPVEPAFLSGDAEDKTSVNAAFKLPKKKTEVMVEDQDSSDDDNEKPSHSRTSKKLGRIKEGFSDGVEPYYSYENDYKLKPDVSYVSLEGLAKVILDELRTNKSIDLSLYDLHKTNNKGKRRSEPEDEIMKALRRLAAFNPCVKQRDTKPQYSTPYKKTKKKENDDEFDERDFDDNDDATGDSSEYDEAFQRTIPTLQNMPNLKDDWVGSEDEDLDGVLSSSSEEDSARKVILKQANTLDTKGSSDHEQKKTKKKKSGESYYYIPGVCRLPKEITSEESDSDDFVSTKNNRGNKKKTVLLSDSDEVLSKKSGGSDNDCLEVISSDSVFRTTKTRRLGRRYSTDSDSDDKKKKTWKRVKDYSDSDVSAKKKLRKRVKEEVDIASGSDSDVKEVLEDNVDKGRKNIRKVMTKKDLRKETRLAEQEEEKRKKRIAERQAQFNELFEAPEATVVNNLVLDFDQKTNQALVSVDPKIAKKLKPHQVEGVRFMWNSCFETVEQFQKPNNEGGGCILAHCMGLGKTLQVRGCDGIMIITFIHTSMTSEHIGLKTALIICPLNTVGNWDNELKMWLRDVDKKLSIHKLHVGKNNEARAHALEEWQRRGGVGIIHYEGFRSLVVGIGLNKDKNTKISAALVSPGPDIVVCDEGHVLKNAKSKVAWAVNQIQTKRRIILTGTPLQNNLNEYHCMMEFVKPKLLGSSAEFSNRFVNPIKNGQHKNSTAMDVSVMKKRAHVLHKLLDGCVQRLDYKVLLPYLPPKYEYVILINLTEIQKKMYTHYLESIKQGGITVKELIRGGQLLKHAAALTKVQCHPYSLEMKSANYKTDLSELEGSLEDFVDDRSRSDVFGSESDDEIAWLDSELKSISKIRIKTAIKIENENTVEASTSELTMSTQAIIDGGDWWSQFFKSKSEMKLTEHSNKLMVLFEILKTCQSIEDKVLVFSQYLNSLDIIESYLKELDELEKWKNTRDTYTDSGSRWRKDIEYFRIDGSTKSADRQKYFDIFNQPDNSRAKLFLISTKAGGVGINLFGANRVVIFDASWNPSQDMQSIFRVFRFGQTKPCYIYRLLAKGTMEEKIYNRQVLKLSLSGRVVDEHQIERHFTSEDIAGMYTFDPDEKSDRPLPPVPKDRLLADLLISQKEKIDTYFEHDSLLQNKVDEELTEEERKIAWDEYQNLHLESERRQLVSAKRDTDLQADMQKIWDNPDKLLTMPQYPTMPENRFQMHVNNIECAIPKFTKLAFPAQNVGLMEARMQSLSQGIPLMEERIQNYLEDQSSPQVSRPAPATVVSDDVVVKINNQF